MLKLCVFCSLLMLQWKSDSDKAVQIVQSALDIDPLCEYAYEILGTICVQKSVSCLFGSFVAVSVSELVLMTAVSVSHCQNLFFWLQFLCQNLFFWLQSVCQNRFLWLQSLCQNRFLWLQSLCQNWFLWLRFRSGGIGVP